MSVPAYPACRRRAARAARGALDFPELPENWISPCVEVFGGALCATHPKKQVSFFAASAVFRPHFLLPPPMYDTKRNSYTWYTAAVINQKRYSTRVITGLEFTAAVPGTTYHTTTMHDTAVSSSSTAKCR